MLKKSFVALVLLCTVGPLGKSYGGTDAASGTRILIKNVNVVDVKHRTIVPHIDILIRGEKIEKIRPHLSSTEALPQDVQVIDGRGLYATPGLIDMHVHMDLWHYGERSDDWAAPLFVANGITTVRDAAGSKLTLALRDAIRAGKRIGPRMVIATPFLTSNDVAPGSNSFSAKTPEEAKAKITDYLKNGYDYVKTNVAVSKDVFSAAVKTTAAHGSYLMGHPLVVKDPGGWVKVDYPSIFRDYQTIEHSRWFFGDFFQSEKSPYFHTTNAGLLLWSALAHPDFSRLPAFLRKMRAAELPTTPTLTPVDITGNFTAVAESVNGLGLEAFRKHPRFRYMPDYVYSDWLAIIKAWGTDPQGEPVFRTAYANEEKILREMDRAGLPILVGTDIPARPTMVHGFSMHDEMARLQKAGVSTWGILRGATISAAEALKMSNTLGSIERGLSADLILTKGNPVRNISVLAKPNAVVTQGKLYNQSGIKRIYADVEREVRQLPATQLRLNDEALACGSVRGHEHGSEPVKK